MSSGYSAHPELASEQLKNAENANKTKNTKTTAATTTGAKMSQRHSPQHRRHNTATTTTKNSNNNTTTTTSRGFFSFSPFKTKTKNAELAKTTTTTSLKQQQQQTNMPPTPTRATTPQKTLPVRTRQNNFPNADDDDDDDIVGNGGEPTPTNIDDDVNTKDCVDFAPATPNLSHHDQLQQHRNRQNNSFYQNRNLGDEDMMKTTSSSTLPPQLPAFSDGCLSGFSSTISSPSPSTVSSPLSTPTRLTTQLQHSHQNCCRKSPGANLTHHQHQHQHQHHHLHHHHHYNHNLATAASSSSSAATAAAAAAVSGCKKLQKFDPRLGPSPYRQLLPIILCILSFATVFTILIIYMDTTEIRHQQFRLNMTRDYDLLGVSQDDPVLVAFLREIHMRKNRLHFLNKNRGDHYSPTSAVASTASIVTGSATTGALNLSAHHDGLAPEMAHYVADLLGNKVNGAVIQSLSGNLGQLITAPWLAETLNWAGIIIEPEPRRYFTLLKQNSQRPHMQVVHACVSPSPYPKEVTIHTEDSDVRINSILDEETSWFNSRVKCFPLYTIMLACNRVEYDLLSLGVHGHELEILKTLPFDKIKIEVISIHLQDNIDKLPRGYLQTIKKFLMEKGYKLQKEFGSNYFYRRINTTNRTRKKDILLLKTP